MKVSKDWLNELVVINSMDELIELIPLRTQGGIKEVTDSTIELDLKGYNRADLLSLRGVAYETAALIDSKVKFSEPSATEYIWVEQSLPQTPVKIMDDELASMQCVAKIEGLKFDKSPDEWIKKLNDSGMRSVNNIADVTNLVMLEFGHPLHSFDASTVKDDTINVRRAEKGETITTLDGKQRVLTPDDIVLADDEKALDVAGVMGGKDTEVTESTTTILLSASLFNPNMVRATSQRLKLTSEASRRFYHGLTEKRLLQAFDAAIKMYQDLGGKLVAVTLSGEQEQHVKKIPLNFEKTRQLIGVEISESDVEQYLKKLNFDLTLSEYPGGEKGWVVTPPYYRLDVEIEEDVIEEVARMYGYEKITGKELPGDKPVKVDQNLFKQITNLKNSSTDNVLTEVQTYSYFSTDVLNNLGFVDEYRELLVKIANPISSETEFLRFTLWPNLLEVAAKNLKKEFKSIEIFEVGKIFIPNEGEKPSEKYAYSAVLVDGTDEPLKALYQIMKSLNSKLGLGLEFNESTAKGVAVAFFHPKRFLSVNKNGEQVGGLSEIHPRLADKFGIQKRTAVVEFYLP